ncbi:S41 family peptidase [Bacteroidota bacterium]
MKKKLLLVIILVSVLFTYCNKPQIASDELFSSKQLRKDLRLLKKYLVNNHPDLYYYTDKNSFNSNFKKVHDLFAEKMTGMDFFRITTSLVTDVKCAHTRLLPSKGFINDINNYVKCLPFRMKFFNKRAYVYKNYFDINTIEECSEIIEINGIKPEEIYDNLASMSSRDGNTKTSVQNQINSQVVNHLLSNQMTDSLFYISFIAPEQSETQNVSLKPHTYREVLSEYWEGLSESEKARFRYEIIDNNIAYMKVGSFTDDEDGESSSFLKESFRKTRNNNISNLIIDLRGNSGGDPERAIDLLSYLTDKEIVYFAKGSYGYPGLKMPFKPHKNYYKSNVYFLIDGGCVSTTGHFCSIAKYHKLGHFIGEETCATYFCNDNSVEKTLPNTKMRLRVARSSFFTAVEGFEKGRGIIPDHNIEYTLEDILTDNDKTLNYTIKHIKENL